MRLLLSLAFAGVWLLAGATPSSAQLQVRTWVVAGGATDASAGGIRLLGTASEPVAGFSALGVRALTHGFWRAGRGDLLVDAPDARGPLPGQLAFEGANPNPFRERTQLAFALPVSAHVSLQLYDMQGRLVATVADGIWDAGVHHVPLTHPGLGSGVYFARFAANGTTITRKLVHTR